MTPITMTAQREAYIREHAIDGRDVHPFNLQGMLSDLLREIDALRRESDLEQERLDL